jgi:hypothetical protein
VAALEVAVAQLDQKLEKAAAARVTDIQKEQQQESQLHSASSAAAQPQPQLSHAVSAAERALQAATDIEERLKTLEVAVDEGKESKVFEGRFKRIEESVKKMKQQNADDVRRYMPRALEIIATDSCSCSTSHHRLRHHNHLLFYFQIRFLSLLISLSCVLQAVAAALDCIIARLCEQELKTALVEV